MSDPYNQYPPQYSSPAPSAGQGYAPPHGGQQQYQSYDQGGYNQYPSPPSQHGDAPTGYGPPVRRDSYGPPQAGGFQHGQMGGQYGAYDASNPQGHAGYYGTPQPYDPNNPYPQQQGSYPPQPHQQQSYPSYDPNNPQRQQSGYRDPNAPTRDPNAPYDPNAPEGERGLGTSLMGGAAGYYMGHKSGHGLLGALGGAIAGNFLGDKFKDRKHGSHHGSQHGGSSSSWGGGRY